MCSFCGNEIEPGTGKIYVKVDGTVYNFCKSKCHKNLIKLNRVPRRIKWTQPYLREKASKATTHERKVPKGKGVKVAKKKPVAQKVAPDKTQPPKEPLQKNEQNAQ